METSSKVRFCGFTGTQFYDGTTGAADATADPDHDRRHEETRAGERDSDTGVFEPHGAGSRHGDAETNRGVAVADASLNERDGSKGRNRKQGQGIARGKCFSWVLFLRYQVHKHGGGLPKTFGFLFLGFGSHSTEGPFLRSSNKPVFFVGRVEQEPVQKFAKRHDVVSVRKGSFIVARFQTTMCFWSEVARCCFGTLSRLQIIFHSAFLVGQKKHSLLDVVLTFCR